MKRIIFLIKSYLPSVFVIFISVVSQFANLFRFPVMEGDEGIYVSQAWWLTEFHKITPYTYWYDHFPLGWLQIGLWQKLTGGPFTFGMSIFSGRIFIGILGVLTVLLLYRLVNYLTKSKVLAMLSVLVYSLSPLMLIYHRLVLLDNIAVFWLILSLYSLITSKGRLLRVALSSLSLAIAFLSKESMIFFLPAYIFYFIYLHQKGNKAIFSFIFFLTFFFLLSLYPLLALLKGEFFPAGWLGLGDHVSFLQTVLFQASRGNGLSFWMPASNFRVALETWTNQDLFTLILGSWATFVVLLYGNKYFKLFSIASIFYIFFLIRGGIVLKFYLIPLLPFFAVNLSLALYIISSKLSLFKIPILRNVGWTLLPVTLFIYLPFVVDNFTIDQTLYQRQVVEYIKENVPAQSVIVSDFTPWLDLRLSRFPGDKYYPNIESFYNVETDPEIRDKKLKNNYLNVDYVLLNSGMLFDTNDKNYTFIKSIIANSKNEIKFGETDRTLDDQTWIEVLKVIHEPLLQVYSPLDGKL